MLKWLGFGIGDSGVALVTPCCGRVLADAGWCRVGGPTDTGSAEPAGTPVPKEVAR